MIGSDNRFGGCAEPRNRDIRRVVQTVSSCGPTRLGYEKHLARDLSSARSGDVCRRRAPVCRLFSAPGALCVPREIRVARARRATTPRDLWNDRRLLRLRSSRVCRSREVHRRPGPQRAARRVWVSQLLATSVGARACGRAGRAECRDAQGAASQRAQAQEAQRGRASCARHEGRLLAVDAIAERGVTGGLTGSIDFIYSNVVIRLTPKQIAARRHERLKRQFWNPTPRFGLRIARGI